MTVPSNLKYTESHEWLRTEADGTITVGITEHAQAELGDLVYVELPEAGRSVEANEACCVVESTKAASDVYAPIAVLSKETYTKIFYLIAGTHYDIPL